MQQEQEFEKYFGTNLSDQEIYHFDQDEVNAYLDKKPWEAKPEYFKKCKISVNAALKMLIHACLGKNNEVMGIMQGRVKDDSFIIFDVIQIHAQASETTVSLTEQSTADMTLLLDYLEKIGRVQSPVGWYHSHPSYGCWLSGTDVATQELQQQGYGAFVAVVIDPIRTMTNSKIDIGAFRVYPPNHQKQNKLDDDQLIPSEKIKDFGAHHHKYYSLEVSFFSNSLDASILQELWQKYWGVRLAQSSLWDNETYFTNGIKDLQSKCFVKNIVNQGSSGGAQNISDLFLDDNKLKIKDTAKFSIEYGQAILSESIKQMLFK